MIQISIFLLGSKSFAVILFFDFVHYPPLNRTPIVIRKRQEQPVVNDFRKPITIPMKNEAVDSNIFISRDAYRLNQARLIRKSTKRRNEPAITNPSLTNIIGWPSIREELRGFEDFSNSLDGFRTSFGESPRCCFCALQGEQTALLISPAIEVWVDVFVVQAPTLFGDFIDPFLAEIYSFVV